MRRSSEDGRDGAGPAGFDPEERRSLDETVDPAPALRIETRAELVSLLSEAAELEHGLVCSYLFTAFTLKEPEAEGLTPLQAEAVGRWREVLTSVALEEMLHLALVSNLLTAVGAAPHLARPPHRDEGGARLPPVRGRRARARPRLQLPLHRVHPQGR